MALTIFPPSLLQNSPTFLSVWLWTSASISISPWIKARWWQLTVRIVTNLITEYGQFRQPTHYCLESYLRSPLLICGSFPCTKFLPDHKMPSPSRYLSHYFPIYSPTLQPVPHVFSTALVQPHHEAGRLVICLQAGPLPPTGFCTPKTHSNTQPHPPHHPLQRIALPYNSSGFHRQRSTTHISLKNNGCSQLQAISPGPWRQLWVCVTSVSF